jgi:hypothetical protein
MSYNSQITQNHENYGQYLQYISDLDMPIKQKFELLYIVNSILSNFVDQAFGVQTDQITLQSIGNASLCHATIQSHPENQTTDAQSYGVEEDSHLLGMSKP